jgi:hypothetical protein
MSRLNELDGQYSVSQSLFSTLLLDPEIPCPSGLVSPSGKSDQKRFSVYRNNVVVGLTGALADIFPAIQRLLGEEAFKNLARIYVANEPPTSPLMFEYGHSFASFVECFEPLQQYPYLADVARIERLWLDAYHAADKTPLALDVLSSFPPEQLGDLTFRPHPATRLLSSQFAAVSIFSANRQEQSMEGINPSVGESCLITRPDTDVDVRQIPQSAKVFYDSLVAGRTLGDAANEAASLDEAFDIAMAISTMVESGMFIECVLAE